MMRSGNERILEVARRELGVEEWPGARHNPAVLAYYDEAGHPQIGNDEVPWCAAFVGSVLHRAGLDGTGSLLARSYLKWGEPVALADVQPGDVVVIPRGKEPWQGHVFFASSPPGLGVIRGIGGNQSNRVSEQTFAFSEATVLGVRRARVDRERLSESTTIRAAGGGAAATVAAGGTAIAGLDGEAQVVALALFAVILIAFLWIARERVRKWVAGVR